MASGSLRSVPAPRVPLSAEKQAGNEHGWQCVHESSVLCQGHQGFEIAREQTRQKCRSHVMAIHLLGKSEIISRVPRHEIRKACMFSANGCAPPGSVSANVQARIWRSRSQSNRPANIQNSAPDESVNHPNAGHIAHTGAQIIGIGLVKLVARPVSERIQKNQLAITLEGVHIAQVLPVLPAPRSAVVQNGEWTFSLSVIVNTNTLVIRKWPLMRIHPTDYSTSRRLARDFLLRYLPFMQALAGMFVSDRDNSVNLFEIGNPKIMEGRMQVEVGRIS